MPARLVQSLYASAMWRLQQRFHLSIANVVIHRFAASRGTAKLRNPDITVRFLGREKVLTFCGDRSLGLDAENVAKRFTEGEIFIASLEGDALAGYDWYRATPACLEPGAVYFRFAARSYAALIPSRIRIIAGGRSAPIGGISRTGNSRREAGRERFITSRPIILRRGEQGQSGPLRSGSVSSPTFA
jgi:hypothetical protein